MVGRLCDTGSSARDRNGRPSDAADSDRLVAAAAALTTPLRASGQAVQTGHSGIDRRYFVRDPVVHFLNVQRFDKHGETVDLSKGTGHFDEQFHLDDRPKRPPVQAPR